MNFSDIVKDEIIENILKNISKYSMEDLEYFLLGFYLTRKINLNDDEKTFKQNKFQKIYIRIINNLNRKNSSNIKKELERKIIDINKKNETLEEDTKLKKEQLIYILNSAFISSGYIMNPEKAYHFEILDYTNEEYKFNALKKILDKLGINFKCYQGKKDNNKRIYIKNGNEIAKVLAMMGLSSAVLKFEETRVIKNVSLKYNRSLNFEISNIEKAIKTGRHQEKIIKKILKAGIKLDEKMKKAADYRLKYPEYSLGELSKISKIPKSSLNYYFKKMEEIAKDL